MWSRQVFVPALAFALAFSGTPAHAQPPAMSRGQQNFPGVSYDECMRRAERALRTVGFTVDPAGQRLRPRHEGKSWRVHPVQSGARRSGLGERRCRQSGR